MPAPRRRSVRLLLTAGALVAVALAALVWASVRDAARADRSGGGAVVEGRPLVAFLGDSWTRGAGATAGRGYAPLTAERLGWGYLHFGIGGSGYSVPGPNDSTYADRVAAAAGSGADVIVVQGSLNERRSTAAALRSAAADTLTRLRAEAPVTARILVVGASYNPGTPDATIDWVNREVAAAAERVGLPFVDPAAENWTDPDDPGVWADPIHPNDRGHALIADRLAPLLVAR
ncbi:SGNH/GDSL hydrolase family protein [Geodermatophilus ruber]|uniref:Lysophospholipase L1 n=1 Tax=Geodermatophilus ruber TaxID=504800 RepID=A0A1I4EUQ4_9ACTN|nr:SGNH/GDSL hydrolase family protein [Geodermatophilus ruber]SFL08850.1 Lysophospholipase L1 [Geodermatophilus ruber]